MSIATERIIVVDYKLSKQIKTINFLQFDTNIIKFIIEDNGVAADLSNITKIAVNFLRADGKVISQELTAVGNEITYPLTDSEMLTPGDCELVLQLYEGDERLTITRIKVFIAANIESGETPTVEEFRLITQLIETVNERLEELSKFEGGEGLKGEDGYTPVKGVDYFDGKDGEKGEPFLYEDFTPEQLEALRGPQGPPGLQGPPGSDANVTSTNVVSALGYTPTKAADITWANVLSKPTTFTPSAHTHAWADITGKPTTFAPSTHTHSYNDLTNKPTIPTLNNAVTSTSTTEAATANAVKQAYDRANQAFTQASDGKNLITNAVTGKGGTVPNDPTFAQLASAITNLPTLKKSRSETFTSTKTLTVTLDFIPSVIIVRSKVMTHNTFAVSTYIKTTIDSGVTNIFNGYHIIAGGVTTEGAMSVNGNVFSVQFSTTENYQGMWIAFE